MKFIAISLTSMIVFYGCAAHTPEQELYLRSEAQKYIECMDEKDCGLKWTRANEWIDENKIYPIKFRSDTAIQTGGPVRGYANPKPSIRIEKQPKTGGGFVIFIDAACGNTVGCVPDRYKLMISFNTYVGTGKRVSPRDVSVP